MPFYKDDRQVYRSIVLDELPWVEHGFGTRASGNWADGAATVTQIHSSIVIRAGQGGHCLGEGDGLITDHPGTMLAVRTADCIPILMADDEHRAVGAVHAGWRGTVAQVVISAVEALKREFGTRPGDIRAVIGPGIGSCCYEVGPEVAEQFQALFPERPDWNGAPRIDLTEANRRLLVKAGLDPSRIVAAGLCTFCAEAEFHSWRRDRTAGRMVSAIGIKT